MNDREIRESFASLRGELAYLRTKLRDVEEDVSYHVGTDFGANMQGPLFAC